MQLRIDPKPLSFLDREYLYAYLRDDKKAMRILRRGGAKIHVKFQRPILRTGAVFMSLKEYHRICLKVTKDMVRQILADDAMWRSIGKRPV